MLSTFWKIWDACDAMLLFDIIFFSMLLQVEFYIIIAYCIRGISGYFSQMESKSDWPSCNFLLWIWAWQTSKISTVLFTFANGLFFLYRRGFSVEDKRHSLMQLINSYANNSTLPFMCHISVGNFNTFLWLMSGNYSCLWEHFNY